MYGNDSGFVMASFIRTNFDSEKGTFCFCKTVSKTLLAPFRWEHPSCGKCAVIGSFLPFLKLCNTPYQKV